jgi:hypothetical protein
MFHRERERVTVVVDMEWKASREEKKLLVFKKSEAMEKKRDAVSVFGNFFGVGRQSVTWSLYVVRECAFHQFQAKHGSKTARLFRRFQLPELDYATWYTILGS